MFAWIYRSILRGIYLTTCIILLGSCTNNDSPPKLPELDFSCNSDSDCCVVKDACNMELWLVVKKQMNEMQSYVNWREQDEREIGCVGCIPPSVQVSCENGQCIGTEIYDGSLLYDLSLTHCGRLGDSDSTGVSASKQMLAADAGTSGSSDIQKTVFGCGS